jgi:predicted deacylase
MSITPNDRDAESSDPVTGDPAGGGGRAPGRAGKKKSAKSPRSTTSPPTSPPSVRRRRRITPIVDPDAFRIGEVVVPRGERREVEIPVAKLPASSVYVTLDVEVVHGAQPGPGLWLSAAVHGDELNGIESIRRVRAAVQPQELHGTLLLVPIVNAFGFINQSRYLPDRRDLNRCFPGSLRGSLAGRLAAIMMRDVVDHCDYGIDLHTGSDQRTNMPQVRADLDDPEAYRCALAFGAPLAVHSQIRDGSLRMAAAERGKHVLVHEAGEALRFEEEAIRSGCEGALRVMRSLGMFGEEARASAAAEPGSVPVARTTKWVRARSSGLLHLRVNEGERVARGDVLGHIRNAFGSVEARVTAPEAGMVIGSNRNPQVRQGDAVVHLATAFEE